ncbi:MAG TPA: hypothetical protein VFW11_12455 [Cyclobacteriaceae bacterium]|nr:hypothetical protein [Cyclobacteriaceae bacterium]
MKLKPLIISIVALLPFLQCSHVDDRLKGEWSILPQLNTNFDSCYLKLTISNDSIAVVDEYQQEIKYSIEFDDGVIQISDRIVNYTIDESGYLSMLGAFYAKKGDKYYRDPQMLDLKLPEIPGNTDLSQKNDESPELLYYGKSKATSTWELQLNNVFASPKELSLYLTSSHCFDCPKPFALLAIDRYTPMGNVDEILQVLRFYDHRNVIFLSRDSSKYFRRTKKGFKTILRPFYDFEALPTVPPRQFRIDLDCAFIGRREYNLIRLAQGHLQCDSVTIEIDNLDHLLIKKIKAHATFMTLFIYNKDVLYEQYVKVLEKINATYTQIRNEASMTAYGVQLDNLDSAHRMEVMKSHPIYRLDLNFETWQKLQANECPKLN